MLDLALSQIYIRVVYLWKCVALDNDRVKDFQLHLFPTRVFSRV